jgi:hypothetical protein
LIFSLFSECATKTCVLQCVICSTRSEIIDVMLYIKHIKYIIISSYVAELCQGEGQQRQQPLASMADHLDILTAPTLRPPLTQQQQPLQPRAIIYSSSSPKNNHPTPSRRSEQRLTIITPSSIVVMFTPRPTPRSSRPSTTSKKPAISEGQLKADESSSVSHSVSVVSVKYSSSDNGGRILEAATAKRPHKTTSTLTSSEAAGLKQTLQNVDTNDDDEDESRLAKDEFTQNPVTERPLPEAVATSMEASAQQQQTLPVHVFVPTINQSEEVEDDRSPKSIARVRIEAASSEAGLVDVTEGRLKANIVVHLSASKLTTTTIKPIITTMTTTSMTTMQPRTASKVVVDYNKDRMRYQHVSETVTENKNNPITTSTASEDDDDDSIPRVIDNRHDASGNSGIISSKSETAQALDELGFTYNEYIDDSDLLGDESNDEVIPAFHESAFEAALEDARSTDDHQKQQQQQFDHDEVVRDADYLSARAVHSKTDQFVTASAEAKEATSSREGKKAPLPHHYEPYTIVGITVGAFLLILFGTGKFIIWYKNYLCLPNSHLSYEIVNRTNSRFHILKCFANSFPSLAGSNCPFCVHLLHLWSK